MMRLCLNILVLLLLQTAHSSPLTAPSRGCSTCKGKQSHSVTSGDLNVTTLALGEPCGVYTASCAHGLRCAPPEGEQRPLRALLEGRGLCSNNASSTSSTAQAHVADTTPTGDPNEAPCRKLLTTIIKGFNSHLFKSNPIYIPNCDKNGFFKKNQCWSSQGRQRGKCWCVDEQGLPLSVNNQQRGSLSC